MWKAFIYPRALANLFGGTSAGDGYKVDWLSDTIRLVGLKSTYTPSDTDEFFADVSADQISSSIDSTHHPSGGGTAGLKTLSYSGGVVTAHATGLSLFNGSGISAGSDIRWLAVYDDTVTDDPLLGYVDFNKLFLEPNSDSLYAICSAIDFKFHAPQAGQCLWYGKALANALGGETSGEDRRTDYLSDSIKVALLSDAYVPDLDADEQFSAIDGDEISGAGYSAGGVALSGKTLTLSGKTLSFGADDPSWATVTAAGARWAVAYNATNGDTPLLWVFDLYGPHSPAAEDVAIRFPGGVAVTLRTV